MLLATRKTKNNLVRTVLASSVLISSMAYMNTAHSALQPVGNGLVATPANAAGGFDFDAGGGKILAVGDVNIGATPNNVLGASIDDTTAAGGGIVNFTGTSTLTGTTGATNPIAELNFDGGAGKVVTFSGTVGPAVFNAAKGVADVEFDNGIAAIFQARTNIINTFTAAGTATGSASFLDKLNVGGDIGLDGSFNMTVADEAALGGDVTLAGSSVLSLNGQGTLAGGKTLLVTNTSTLNFGDDYTITKDLTATGTDANNRATVNINAGTLTVSGTAGTGSSFTDTVLTVSAGATFDTKALSFLGNSLANLQLGTASAIGTIDGTSVVNFNDNYTITGALGIGATAGSNATATVASGKTLQVDGAITVSNGATLNVLGTLDNDAAAGKTLTLADTATVNLFAGSLSQNIVQAAGTTLNFTGGAVATNNAGNLNITGAGNVLVSNGAVVTIAGALINGGGTTANFVYDLGNTDTPGVINVTGNAAIAATQTVTITNYNLGTIPVNGSVTKNLITAGGGAGVEPTNLTPTNPFINFELLMAGNDLTLKMSRQTPAGLDGNASNLGNIFSQLAITNVPGELGVLLDNLGDIATSPEKLNEDLAEIAPQGINGGIVDSSFGVTNETFDLFSQRINELRAGLDSYHTGYAAGHMTESGHGTWVKVFGNHADQGRRGNIAGYTGETWGLAVGTDMMITERHLIGVSGSFGSTDVNFDSQRGGTDINSYQGAFYGSWNVTTPLFVNWMASAAYNKYKETQLISVGGFNQASLGEFDGWQYGARAELGYVFGEQCFHIVPTVDLTYNHVSFDSFRQKGNSTANQVIDYGSVSALLAGVGVKFSYDYEMQKALLQPEVHANVSYDILGDEMDANARFVGFGTSYNVQGASVKRTDYNVGLSLTTYGHSGLGFSISYDYDWKTHYHAHSGFLRIRYEW